MPAKQLLLLCCAVTLGAAVALAFGALDGSFLLPLDHPAIQYEKRALHDAVTQLAQRLDSGEVKLDYDPKTGYLPALLKLLQIPVSSQVLVFSKTSFQSPRISPRIPRALYYNDRSAVGYVRTGDVLELTSVDPQAGVVFYTLDVERTAHPVLVHRTGDCLQCHVSGGTLGIPGMMVRSVFPGRDGMPLFQAGSFVSDHRSPLRQRWGGWYVTGTSGSQDHMGNVVVEDVENPESIVGKGTNIVDLQWRVNSGAYLSPGSDIVSLMVLEHQTRMTNLIVRVNYETRMAMYEQTAMNTAFHEPAGQMSASIKRRIENASEELLKYMLFTDETVLSDEIKGSSTYASDFVARGPRDRKGRSLRDLDMKHRMFRYPCSYLIYSEAFDGLPDEAKGYIYRRLFEVLSGQDRSKQYATLAPADRQNIIAILLDTKKGLPAYWRESKVTAPQ